MRGERVRVFVAAMAAVVALSAAVVAPVSALGAIITVNTLSDGAPANDGSCTLREAITAASTNTASGAAGGECQAGTNDLANPDHIEFSVGGSITIGSNLPHIVGGVDIDGDFAITVNGQDSYLPFFIESGTVYLRDLVVTNGFSAFGGAIANGGTLNMERTTVSSSNATYGGGIYNNGGLNLRNSTVSGNTAQYGAGVYNESASTITNSTIAKNTASTSGGGLYATGAVTIVNATIALNTAPVGGGIHQAAGAMSIYNTLVLGNTTGNVVAAGAFSKTVSLTAGSGSGVIDTALRNNGGPTSTVRLLSTATAAIDKASTSFCASYTANLDQRGMTRPDGACDIGAVERNKVAPKITSRPKVSLRTGVALDGTSSRAKVAWSGADDAAGAGIDHFTIGRQVNGGSWTTLSSSVAGNTSFSNLAISRSYNVTLKKDATYRFRVRAVDQDGNASAWVYTPTFTARLVQQTSSAVTFGSGWTTANATSFSGGSAKYASVNGKAARFTFTGRGVALVSTVRTTGAGTLKVYVDGTLADTIPLTGLLRTYRAQVFSKTFASSASHTIRLVLSGGGRVDVDAFAVMR